ncbi:MAG: hypothetical protein ACKVOP_03755 [Sphingomonadaceae bacterium]
MAKFSRCVVSILLLALPACATLRGGPERVPNAAEKCDSGKALHQSALAVLADQQCLRIDWLGGGSELKAQRNHVVTMRMFVADKLYYDFERQLLNEGREGNFGTTLAQLALSTAASVVTQGPDSRSLSATGTLVTGAKQGFDRDVMLERTIQILTTQMRASRARSPTHKAHPDFC